MQRKTVIKYIFFQQNKYSLEKDNCYIIHEIFNKIPRMYWNDIDMLPFNNGIYVMFEKGEKYFGMDRIVRIGTLRQMNA